MNHKEYNGWYNYETWAVKLWIDNEEFSYRFWQGKARDAFSIAIDSHEKYFTPSEQARINLADILKEHHEENNPLAPHIAPISTVYTDLMSAALSEVNWHEIANALLEEVEVNGQKYEYAND